MSTNLQVERNCQGQYISEEEKDQHPFPPHELSPTDFMWECPASAVLQHPRLRIVMEYFFKCYQNMGGQNAKMVLLHLPFSGGLGEQPAYLIRGMDTLAHEMAEIYAPKQPQQGTMSQDDLSGLSQGDPFNAPQEVEAHAPSPAGGNLRQGTNRMPDGRKIVRKGGSRSDLLNMLRQG